MNHCESYEPLLDAFAEGDLFMEDMVWVQQHLNSCPDCQAYVDDLLAIRAAFPSVEDTEVPAGFTAGVMAAVAATPQTAVPAGAAGKAAAKTARKSTQWVKVLSGLAACCAIVLLAQGGLRLGAGGGNAMAPREEEKAAPAAEAPAEMYMATSDSAPEAREQGSEQKLTAPKMEAQEETTFEEAAPEAAVIMEPEAEAPAEDGASGRNDDVTGGAAPYRIVITVDADYIGDALEGHRPVAETTGAAAPGQSGTPLAAAEYELTLAEYDALLARLADRDEMPAEEVFNTDSQLVLVIVRQ